MHDKWFAIKAIVVAAQFTCRARAQSIPPDFTPSSDVQLQVSYGAPLRIIQPGQTVLFSQTTPTMPTLGLDVQPSLPGPYLVTMIDPDAPTPANPNEAQILHWLQPGLEIQAPADNERTMFSYMLSATAEPVAPFYPPMPPAGSPPHRYIQILWQQPQDFAVPEAFSGFNAKNRTLFDVASFAAAAGLGGPVAANYFLTSKGFLMPNGSGMPAPTVTGGMTTTGPGMPAYTGTAPGSVHVTKLAIGMSAAVLMFAALL